MCMCACVEGGGGRLKIHVRLEMVKKRHLCKSCKNGTCAHVVFDFQCEADLDIILT